MNLFDRLLVGTGVIKKKNASKELLLRENIQPSESFQQSYTVWEEGEDRRELLDHLLRSYQEKKHGASLNESIQLYESSNANGIYFRNNKEQNIQEFYFLRHYFTRQLLAQNYVQQQAIRKVIDDKRVLKTTETIYLKPSLQYRRERPYQQLFGNVQVEHRLIDGESELIKIMATTYTDRMYARPYDFEDLMQVLFD